MADQTQGQGQAQGDQNQGNQNQNQDQSQGNQANPQFQGVNPPANANLGPSQNFGTWQSQGQTGQGTPTPPPQQFSGFPSPPPSVQQPQMPPLAWQMNQQPSQQGLGSPYSFSQGGQIGQQSGGFPQMGGMTPPPGSAQGMGGMMPPPGMFQGMGGMMPPPPPPVDPNKPKYSFGQVFQDFSTNIVIPAHSLKFDEKYFLRLLAGSISLTKDEKLKIIKSIPKLSQYQIDELIKILEEEQSKFKELSEKHGDQLQKLEQKHFEDWKDLEIASKAEEKSNEDKSKADDIRKSLGL